MLNSDILEIFLKSSLIVEKMFGIYDVIHARHRKYQVNQTNSYINTYIHHLSRPISQMNGQKAGGMESKWAGRKSRGEEGGSGIWEQGGRFYQRVTSEANLERGMGVGLRAWGQCSGGGTQWEGSGGPTKMSRGEVKWEVIRR